MLSQWKIINTHMHTHTYTHTHARTHARTHAHTERLVLSTSALSIMLGTLADIKLKELRIIMTEMNTFI